MPESAATIPHHYVGLEHWEQLASQRSLLDSSEPDARIINAKSVVATALGRFQEGIACTPSLPTCRLRVTESAPVRVLLYYSS